MQKQRKKSAKCENSLLSSQMISLALSCVSEPYSVTDKIESNYVYLAQKGDNSFKI